MSDEGDGSATTQPSARSRLRSLAGPGSVVLPDGELGLRAPRLDDATEWSTVRLANREWLERAFPAWSDDWAAEQSEAAWVQRWSRLRRGTLRGRSIPFVITLDDRLIGEIGIDAVDEVSGAGEASVWMVRSHGSADVMRAASLLLIEAAFTGRHPVERILSPVATSSRRGRAPGLTEVGFSIEATIPRRVGSRGLVDHDLWVVHNTAEARRATSDALLALRSAAPTGARPPRDARADRRRSGLAAATGRALWREARHEAHRARVAVVPQEPAPGRRLALPGGTRQVELRPATKRDERVGGRFPDGAERLVVDSGTRVEAEIGHRTDAGTATTEVFAALRPGGDRDALTVALDAVVDELRPRADEQRVLVVRVDKADATAPDADLLTGLGLGLLASLPVTPGRTHPWGGEDLWRAPAAT